MVSFDGAPFSFTDFYTLVPAFSCVSFYLCASPISFQRSSVGCFFIEELGVLMIGVQSLIYFVKVS